MRYRLRTLLILLAVGPPILALILYNASLLWKPPGPDAPIMHFEVAGGSFEVGCSFDLPADTEPPRDD